MIDKDKVVLDTLAVIKKYSLGNSNDNIDSIISRTISDKQRIIDDELLIELKIEQTSKEINDYNEKNYTF